MDILSCNSFRLRASVCSPSFFRYLSFVSNLEKLYFYTYKVRSCQKQPSFSFLGFLHVSRNVTASSANNEAFRQRIKARKYSTISPSARETKLESGFFKPELVIFDKDGTLVCFHTMWTPWCTSLAARMKRETKTDVTEQLYDLLGNKDWPGKKVTILLSKFLMVNSSEIILFFDLHFTW